MIAIGYWIVYSFYLITRFKITDLKSNCYEHLNVIHLNCVYFESFFSAEQVFSDELFCLDDTNTAYFIKCHLKLH